MQSLNDLRDLCLKIANEKGFTEATIGEDLMLMVSELAEALEDHRKGREPSWVWYETKSGESTTEYDDDGKPSKPCGIPTEIADLIIRALHFCGKHDIDIQSAVMKKIEFNRTRPFKHGKKL